VLDAGLRSIKAFELAASLQHHQQGSTKSAVVSQAGPVVEVKQVSVAK